MDYSKIGGGTRIPDQLEARTLATGIGQTYRGARESGSSRAEKVVQGMKPGQLVADPGLRQVKVKKDDETAAMQRMDPAPEGPKSVENAWPLSSGSKSHHEATGQLKMPAAMADQGEDKRQPATGRHSNSVHTTSLARR